MNLSKDFWNWNRIFDTIYDFMENFSEHNLKFLELRVDFFSKHKSQLT